MKTEVEGIPQEKLDRLWMHLLKTEELTGRKLRKTPRDNLSDCPICNFAPGRDESRREFLCVSISGTLQYEYPSRYEIYTGADSLWWTSLNDKHCIAITRWVMKKLKERE